MKTFVDAIEAAEKVSTKKEKFAALSGIVPGQQRLIVEALNPYRVFHVKKWEDQPERHPVGNSVSEDQAPIDSFYTLLDNLHNGKLTGGAARAAVQDTLSWYTKRTAKYLARVLMKDLDCGAQVKTFKKVYPDLKIPSFKVMLAEKMDSKYKWKFPCLAEAKYDGQRVIAFVDAYNRTVIYLSRNGKPADFCNGIFDKELIKLVYNEGDSSGRSVIDGEVMASSFQNSMIAKGRKNDEEKKHLRFNVFDWMPEYDWRRNDSSELQSDRSISLRRAVESNNLSVVPAKRRVVRSITEAKEFYKEVLKEGYEGLIIKDLDAKYQWKRSSAWTKWKSTITLDLTITEVRRGSGKYSNTCGALMLEGKDENGLKIKTKMGSGLSDGMREYFWKHRTKVVGKIVEIEAQEMTKAKNSNVFSLRFPTFKRIRTDK